MSQPSPGNREDRKSKSNSSRLWIGLSLVLSTLILGWAFSLPFRQGSQPLVSSTTTSQGSTSRFESPEQLKERRTRAEEFRQAAIALDQEFMQRVAEKQRRPENLPGKRESKRHWNRHIERVKKQLDQLKDAEEGTLEWQYREKLEQSLQDGPQ